MTILAAILLAAAASAAAPDPGRRVAVTIDDLPGPSRAVLTDAGGELAAFQRMTSKLLAALTSTGTPAIGFVNEGKLASDGRRDAARVALLEAWLAAGMELGGSVSEETLQGVTLRCLQEAERRGLRSLALPAIGAGLGGLSLQRCAELMLGVVERHLAAGSTLEEVRFVLSGEPAYRVFENVRDGQAARRQLERLRGLREKK